MAALIMLFFFFPLQYVLNFTNANIRINADRISNQYIQQSRTVGYWTNDMITNLKNELATKLNIAATDITITVTQTPKYRLDAFDEREFIDYEIIVPVPRILAMANYFDLSPAENRTVYPIVGKAPSEVLPP